MVRKLVCFMLLLVFAFVGAAQAVDLTINNPGFEGGWVDQGWGVPYPPGVPAGWGSWEGSDVGYLAPMTGTAPTPDNGLEVGVHAGQAGGGYAFVWNGLKPAVGEGMLLTLSADIIDLTPDGAVADFAFLCLDGTPAGKYEVKIAGVTSSWGRFSINLLTLAGTTEVEVKLGASTDNPLYENVGCAYGFDNVVLTAVVPEPATMVLLGLGSLALLKRRKS